MTHKKLTALLLALVMTLSLLSGITVFADSSVTITFMLSDEDFIIAPTELTVAPDIAASYGYEDDETTVSVLDAIVAAHKLMLEDKFTPETAEDFLMFSGGFIGMMFMDDRNCGFLVNGRQPHGDNYNPLYGSYDAYTADKSYLNDGDVVNVYFYQDDDMYFDYYAWFDQTEVTAKPGEEIILNLKGYPAMWYGASKEETIDEKTEDLWEVMITYGTDPYVLDELDWTDDDGNVTFSFDEPGVYYISAQSYSDEYTYFIPPLCMVTIADEAEPTEEPTEVPTLEPTEAPTEVPTIEPTEVPTEVPTLEPTEIPTEVPTIEPTEIPTEVPTIEPTATPTAEPTDEPTATPHPSASPTPSPQGEGFADDKIEQLLVNISNSYANTDDAWSLFDMAVGGYSGKLTNKDAAIQSLIDEAYSAAGIGSLSRNALAIKAFGGNLNKLKISDGTEFDMIEKLADYTAADITYVTDAVFAMSVYDSGDYTVNGNLTREALLEYILTSRNSDGIWGYEWAGQVFPDYDSTAMVLNALAPYYSGESAEDVGISEEIYTEIKSTVDSIVTILSSVQGENGSFYGSNTDAMVIVGLAAIGIDPGCDERFVKNGNSVIDGILGYALDDNSGFGFTDNSELNRLSTEQSFRALIAYNGFKAADGAYNVYKTAAADNTPEPTNSPSTGGNTGGSGGGGFGTGGNITVSVTVVGDTPHGEGKHTGGYPTWISKTTKTVASGSKAADVIKTVLAENDYTAGGINNGYISSITTPDGVTIGEFTNGSNSGWLYTVNGVSLKIGIDSYTLKNGDAVRLYYSDDYTKDGSVSSGGSVSGGSFGTSGGSQSGAGSTDNSAATATPTPEPSTNTEAAATGYTDVTSEHWAYDYITRMSESGLLNGYSDGSFKPDANITRAELVTVLYRAFDGVAATADNDFADVSEGDWHAEYIAWALNMGYITGYPDGTFKPDNNITREDICVILARAAADREIVKAEVSATDFSDQDAISDYAIKSIQKMQSMGIVNGKENNTFAPQAPATRAEVCKMVSELIM